MSASPLALAPASPTEGLATDGSYVVPPTDETAEQDLLAGLLISSQGMACACALLRNFPSIGHVISAEASQLRAFGLTGHDVALFRIVPEIACRMARAEVRPRPVLSNWQALITYLQTAMAYEQIEQFRILFLDRRNGLIAGEVQQRGTVSHTPVYPREVMKRALILNASAIIVAHNHPSGDPGPSMTRELKVAASALEIDLHDHVVIGHGKARIFLVSRLALAKAAVIPNWMQIRRRSRATRVSLGTLNGAIGWAPVRESDRGRTWLQSPLKALARSSRSL